MGLWLRLWLRFWHGIQDGDTDLQEVRNILTRVENLEPVSKSGALYGGATGWTGWTLKFIQYTPDGDLATTVTTTPDTASVVVTLEPVDCLRNLLYCSSSLVTTWNAKYNGFAVQFVHAWVAQRVLPALEAAAEQKRQAEQSASEEREAKLAPMRKKYLP